MRRRAPAGSVFVVVMLVSSLGFAQAPPHLPPPPPPPPGSQPMAPSPQPTPQPQQPAPRPRREPPSPPPSVTVVQAPRSPRQAPQAPQTIERDEAPPARTGFQIALRTGLSLPLGKVTGADGDAMRSAFAGQVPIFVEAGAKITPAIFIGGYASLAVGGTASKFQDAQGCGSGGRRSCASGSFRLGAEILYSFMPEARMNPWIGYGIGIESSGVGSSGDGPDFSATYGGFDFAHLQAGLDFRLGRLVGVGPFMDFSFGRYSRETVQQNGRSTDVSIPSAGFHEWLTIGIRVPFFP